MMENYPLSEGTKSPKLDRLIYLKSKLKKHQKYTDNSELIVFSYLFNETNISNIIALLKDGRKFSVKNFIPGIVVTVECSILSYIMTDLNMEDYFLNLLLVLFLEHPS